jgi:hypothetical protein
MFYLIASGSNLLLFVSHTQRVIRARLTTFVHFARRDHRYEDHCSNSFIDLIDSEVTSISKEIIDRLSSLSLYHDNNADPNTVKVSLSFIFELIFVFESFVDKTSYVSMHYL